mmetsp:Transcript_136191/g.339631  ORF Transcript_136191/g.339631 Transcript_136191/m.339631 type:complete len:87 (+) Transcript_136191:389-649(+)
MIEQVSIAAEAAGTDIGVARSCQLRAMDHPDQHRMKKRRQEPQQKRPRSLFIHQQPTLVHSRLCPETAPMQAAHSCLIALELGDGV